MTLAQLQQIVTAYQARSDWQALNNDANFVNLYWNFANQVGAGNVDNASTLAPSLLSAYPLATSAAATPVTITVPVAATQPAATISPWLLWGGIGLAAYFLLK